MISCPKGKPSGFTQYYPFHQPYAVKRFVLVSTDKAVNPVNVMSMTKRVAELLVLRPKEVSKGSFRWLRLKPGNLMYPCVSATCWRPEGVP